MMKWKVSAAARVACRRGPRVARRPWLRTTGALAVLALGTACGWFDDRRPRDVRINLAGPAGAAVEFITSSRFLAGVGVDGITRVSVIVAETTTVTLPFEARYDIRQEQQFLARAGRLDTDLPDLRMQVFVNDEVRFDERGPLLPEAPYVFVYTFNQRITHSIQVTF
jgi:hypothetical protein